MPATTASPIRYTPVDRKHEHWFEIFDNGERIAFAQAEQCTGSVWIMELAVHPENRGHGLATRLLTAVIDRLGGQDLELSASPFTPDWKPADQGLDREQLLAWYGRHGFQAAENPQESGHMLRYSD